MANNYDLVILGGGIGGYTAAIRASQLGMNVAIVEKSELGGTCLHRGCIPSKSLLESAEVFRQTKAAEIFGVNAEHVSLNFSKVQERTRKIVQTLHKGVTALVKKEKIDVFHGYGRILGASIFSPIPGTISVEYANGEENTMLIPKNVLIATGSQPRRLPGLDVDGEYIFGSDEALQMKKLPESIIIIGGGVIGVEWASMLADFGVHVTVIEAGDQLLPSEDRSIAEEAEKQLHKKGIKFLKNAVLVPETLIKENGIAIDINVKDVKQTLQAQKLLVAIGREGNTANIGLDNTEIVSEEGFIQTNRDYQTKETHIYAVGDVIGGMQLAHVAAHEGIRAVEHMAGENPLPVDYKSIPACIYSHPEIASIGMTEKEAREKGFEIKIGQFPFNANGKAMIKGEVEGFVKLIEDKKTADILGIHMIGPGVTDLIAETSLAKLMDATPWEITQAIHPHPTLSETVWEAALAVDHKQIHA